MSFSTFMNYTLVKKGYQNIEEVPKEVFLNAIITYFLRHTDASSLDVYTLFQEYVKSTTQKEELEDIIYYLLGYISIIQNFQVNWYINESVEPMLTFNMHYPDKIDGLNTKEEFD